MFLLSTLVSFLSPQNNLHGIADEVMVWTILGRQFCGVQPVLSIPVVVQNNFPLFLRTGLYCIFGETLLLLFFLESRLCIFFPWFCTQLEVVCGAICHVLSQDKLCHFCSASQIPSCSEGKGGGILWMHCTNYIFPTLSLSLVGFFHLFRWSSILCTFAHR